MRTKSGLLTLALMLSVLTTTFAQKEETVLGDRGMRFTGFWANWNNQITQLNTTNSYMSGWQFNLEFGRSLLLGYGNYYLREDIEWDQIQNQDFDMRLQAFKVGYAFQSYRAIHPVLNVDFGPGKIELSGEDDDRIFMVQPSAGLEINVFRWMRLGLEGGYRFITDTNIDNLRDEDLSGYFGQATLKFGLSWGRGNNRKND